MIWVGNEHCKLWKVPVFQRTSAGRFQSRLQRGLTEQVPAGVPDTQEASENSLVTNLHHTGDNGWSGPQRLGPCLGLPLMCTHSFSSLTLCPVLPQLRSEYQQGHTQCLGNNVPYLGRGLYDAQNSLWWQLLNWQSRGRPFHFLLYLGYVSGENRTHLPIPWVSCVDLQKRLKLRDGKSFKKGKVKSCNMKVAIENL